MRFAPLVFLSEKAIGFGKRSVALLCRESFGLGGEFDGFFAVAVSRVGLGGQKPGDGVESVGLIGIQAHGFAVVGAGRGDLFQREERVTHGLVGERVAWLDVDSVTQVLESIRGVA